MDYGFHMAVTSWSPKVFTFTSISLIFNQVSAAMEALVQEGINSFKFFMAYKVSCFFVNYGLGFSVFRGP